MTDYQVGGESISSAHIEKLQLNSIKGKSFEWINIDTPTPALLNSLMSLYSFHHLDVRELSLHNPPFSSISKGKEVFYTVSGRHILRQGLLDRRDRGCRG